MLDILTIVHNFADTQTASRMRRTCRRLAILTSEPTLYSNIDAIIVYEYRVGSKLHRLDGPAKKNVYGYKGWYRGDIEHREYHPQCTNVSHREYIVEGLCHREVGPSIIDKRGEMWYSRGLLHRKTGPAHSLFGNIWYTMDNLHRLDGPAYLDLYSIRGIEHRISGTTDDTWRVNSVIIRK